MKSENLAPFLVQSGAGSEFSVSVGLTTAQTTSRIIIKEEESDHRMKSVKVIKCLEARKCLFLFMMSW